MNATDPNATAPTPTAGQPPAAAEPDLSSVEGVKTAIDHAMRSPALHDPRDPGHAEALENKSRLFERLDELEGEAEPGGDAPENQRAAVLQELREEWGADYDARIEQARAVVDQFGDDALRAYLNETGLGDDPRMIRAIAKVGEALAGKGVSGAKPFAKMSAAELDAEIAAVMASPELSDDRHPGHARAVERKAELFRLRHPD